MYQKKSRFISILQQRDAFDISSFLFERKETVIHIKTKNAVTLAVDLDAMAHEGGNIQLDGQEMNTLVKSGTIYYSLVNDQWVESESPSKKEKGPHRNGGFKDAFRHRFILVYASNGSEEENQWYYNRARNDAEKFWYRANGNVEIIRDVNFIPENYPDRNIILYGNGENNSAWNKLLNHCPIEVSNNKLKVGEKILSGDQWGAYFIYPRMDSDIASIGVITATGIKGMKGAYANDYLVNGTTFPDLTLFDHSMMSEGVKGVQCSGFFGNDWSLEKGAFVWRKKE